MIKPVLRVRSLSTVPQSPKRVKKEVGKLLKTQAIISQYPFIAF